MGGIDDEGLPELTTVTELITSSRYDLRDTSSLQWSNAELLDYLNRALRQLDNALSAQQSDWVWTEESTTLSSGLNYIAAPERTIAIREIWIDQTQLYKKTAAYVSRERQYSTSGQPYYWAHGGAYINFEREADQDYTIEIRYDERYSPLILADDMPYRDEFNDSLKQMMVFVAKHRNEFGLDLDAYMFNFFMGSAMSNVTRRTYVPTAFRLDY